MMRVGAAILKNSETEIDEVRSEWVKHVDIYIFLEATQRPS